MAQCQPSEGKFIESTPLGKQIPATVCPCLGAELIRAKLLSTCLCCGASTGKIRVPVLLAWNEDMLQKRLKCLSKACPPVQGTLNAQMLGLMACMRCEDAEPLRSYRSPRASDNAGHIECADIDTDGRKGCAATVDQYNLEVSTQGSLRIHVLDLMACMGVEVCKAMPPHSITHVIAGDLHDNTSKKLVHAREVQ